VFNAAAYTAVDKAESEPEAAHRLNALAPGLIAAAARAAGARTVQLSTDFVFDGCAASPRAPGDLVGPQGVYARTKLEGEQRAAGADPDALIVRTAWVYAPRGANFVNTMLRLMKERDALRVVANQVGTPTWAPSLAAALWTLAGAGAKGLLHYTDAGVASWYDFAVAIEEEGRAAGLIERPVAVAPIATADHPTAARRPAYSVLDKSAAWALIGRPAAHWRVNLRANLQELKANG
jgi:dTDP-4-dehydrorhamnose reductase